MSLSSRARARIEEIAAELTRFPETEVRRALLGDESSPLHACLHIATDGGFRATYAPFDWINDQADIILIGITPGFRQAADALTILRRHLVAGTTVEAAAKAAKESASFKGMRALAAQLMDSLNLASVSGLSSCDDLFEAAAWRVHSTSILRYPVFKNGKT